jgi:hypothetical protein
MILLGGGGGVGLEAEASAMATCLRVDIAAVFGHYTGVSSFSERAIKYE